MEQIPIPTTTKGPAERFIGDVFVDGVTGPEPGAVWGEHITNEEYEAAVSRLG